MITEYRINVSWGHKSAYYHTIYAVTEKSGFRLPVKFPVTPIGKVEAEQLVFNLAEWYGLPVDPKTIMNHFNLKLLEETKEELLQSAVQKCQQILAMHIEPGSGISEKDAILMLLYVLDNQELIKKMNA